MAKTLASLLAAQEPQRFFLGGAVKSIGKILGGGGSASAPAFLGQDYTPQLKAAQQQQEDVYKQQQNLAQALLLQSQGLGPSVAQNQLQQATGQNIAGQAALMAGQRGASSNPALMARQIGMQGGDLQQQMVGQAATMRAQEQMAAQQALQQQQEVMARQAIAQQQAYLGGQTNQARLQMEYDQDRLNRQAAQAQLGTQFIGGLLGTGTQAAMMAAGKPPVPTGGGGMGGQQAATGYMPGQMQAAHGGQINGGVATKPGDHYDNDTVPALLSPGEIVIPRSIAQSKDAPQKAKEFIEALKARKGYGYEEIAKTKKYACGGKVK